MSRFAWPSHGGQATALLAHFGLPADHRLEDFSANLNPLGPPAWVRDWLGQQFAGLEHYPAPDYAAARQAIAAHHQLQPEQVLLTNGGAEAIYLAAALHSGKRAAIMAPSFGEYTCACKAHGLKLTAIPLAAPHFTLEQATLLEYAAEAEVVFLCRPNNPTGTLIDSQVVEVLLAQALAQGAQVVVDEAFIDMTLGANALTPLLARYPNLLLLHSMTKFYSLPGLRLGYMLAGVTTIDAAKAHQPPWSVNHLAAELVAPLLEDDAFARRTQRWLARERPQMAQALAELGFDIAPGHSGFFLIRPGAGHSMSTDVLFEQLLRQGMLVRHTHNFAGLDGQWLRVALRDASANQRLISVLKKLTDTSATQAKGAT